MNNLFKKEVLNVCLQKLSERLQVYEDAMLRAQELANSEQKSSAGDKYETSRAMAQLDRDMHARQAAEVQKEIAFLNKINPDVLHNQVAVGSLVQSQDVWYFIGVGLQAIEVNDVRVITLSSKAPLSKILSGKKCGDEVVFNDKKIIITEVC